MAKFKIIASYISACEIVIDAENEAQAYQMAKELDGGDFKPLNVQYDWHITDVIEESGKDDE